MTMMMMMMMMMTMTMVMAMMTMMAMIPVQCEVTVRSYISDATPFVAVGEWVVSAEPPLVGETKPSLINVADVFVPDGFSQNNVVEPPKEACYFMEDAGQGEPYDTLFTKQQKSVWETGTEAAMLIDGLSTYLLEQQLSLDLDQGKPAGTQINQMVVEWMDGDDIVRSDFRFHSTDAIFEGLQAVSSTAPAETALSDILKHCSCPGSTNGVCADPTTKPGNNKPTKPTFVDLHPWSATVPWNVTLGGLNKTFIEEDIKNDVKVCIHDKYDTPDFMNVDEYSSMVHAFNVYKKTEKKKKPNPNNAAGEKTQKELAQEKADTIVGPVSEVKSYQWAYGYEYGHVDDKMQSVLDVLSTVSALSEGDAVLDKTARKIPWKVDNLVELKIGVTKIKNGPSESGVNVLRMNAVAEFPEPLNDINNDSSLADQIAAIYADYGFEDPALIFDRDINNDRAGKLLLINMELRATEPASASSKSIKSSKKTSQKRTSVKTGKDSKKTIPRIFDGQMHSSERITNGRFSSR